MRGETSLANDWWLVHALVDSTGATGRHETAPRRQFNQMRAPMFYGNIEAAPVRDWQMRCRGVVRS